MNPVTATSLGDVYGDGERWRVAFDDDVTSVDVHATDEASALAAAQTWATGPGRSITTSQVTS
jgi:hypothetical protein